MKKERTSEKELKKPKLNLFYLIDLKYKFM